MPRTTRRTFLKTAGTLSLIASPHILLGAARSSPNEKLNIAGIGVGGMGAGDLEQVSSENIVALCDVDDASAAGTYKRFPQARRYKDFRLLLEKEEKNIDAVVVATPDHVHAPASMMAIRMKKHVYCEKPLTQTLHEARKVTEAAREAGVATQMGQGGHANEGARLTNEWIWSGAIGEVREVHVWTDRAGNLWKQGIGRPAETPPVPATLDWNLWLGPAQERPYHPAYAPKNWRGWWDFGTGGLGDMGCHIIDHPFWALDLGQPTSVQAVVTSSGTFLPEGGQNQETYPLAAVIYYEFPARGKLPPVRMIWYDGGLQPPIPADIEPGQSLPGNGALFIGDKGKLY